MTAADNRHYDATGQVQVDAVKCEHKVGSYLSQGTWRCRSCNAATGVRQAVK
jgi:hypothetical protein